MNGFEKHGIKWLSHSSVDDFIESQAMWCIKYLGNRKDGVGPAAWRGSAAEAGLATFCRTGLLEEAANAAYSKFDFEAMFANDFPGIAEERAAIPRYLNQATTWATRNKVELLEYQIGGYQPAELPDMPIPFKYWIDFRFKGLGCVDMKTRKSLQFKGSDDRQLAIYKAITGEPQSLLCVTPSKYECLSYGDNRLGAALDQVRKTVLRMERFLSRVENAADALSILSINPDNWKVNSSILEAHAELTGA